MRLRTLAVAASLAASTALLAAPASADIAPSSLSLATISPAGAVGNGGNLPSLVSADGSTIAIASTSTNLIDGFVNNNGGAVDIYARDLTTGTTVLASRAVGTTNAGTNSNTSYNDISGDGRYILFSSIADNLVSGFSTSAPSSIHLYLFDTELETVTLVDKVPNAGNTAGTGSINEAVISTDGTTVAFTSDALDLVPGSTGTGDQAYVLDIATGAVSLLSHAPGSTTTGGDDDTRIFSISADGSTVGFASYADNLVSGFTPTAFGQTFVAVDGTLRLFSGANGSATTGGNGESYLAYVSDDASTVLMTTEATDLVAGVTDANGTLSDVYAYDVEGATLSLVSHTAASTSTTGDSFTEGTGISAIGHRASLYGNASDLVPGFVNNNGSSNDAYIADLNTNVLQLLSRAGGPGNQGSDDTANAEAISRDGRVVIISTAANNLGWASNGSMQAAAAIADTGQLLLLSSASPGQGGNAPVLFATTGYGSDSNLVSATGAVTTFNSQASNLAVSPQPDGSQTQVLVANIPVQTGQGYWLIARDGGVFSFGDATFYGSTGGLTLNQPIVGGSSTPSGDGYWFVASDGGVFSFGDAQFSGSTGALTLNQPIVGMIPVPYSNSSYWLVARDGGIFSFGPDAEFFGSTGALTLNQPIVGGVPTPSGNGYWFVAADGGIFSFGDAAFYGSTGALTLNQPIVAMAATPSGNGYWLIARDGGVFSFGDAAFYGSTGAVTLNQPIVGGAASPTGAGYWFVAADGGVFSFGDARFHGSTGAMKLNQPIVGMAVS